MRNLPLFVAFLWCGLSNSQETIPDSWKNNPILGKVYLLKRDVGSLHAGDRVAISIRTLGDSLIRSEPTKMGLLKLSGPNYNDPGICDESIPWEDASEYLTLTAEDAPPTHWQHHYKLKTEIHKPDVKPEYWHSNNFPITVYPAAKFTSERPRLILQGSVYYIIKPSPFCKKDELTIRLEPHDTDDSKIRYYEEKRRLSPPFEIAGHWYGSDYCVSIASLIQEGPAQHGLIDPPLPDQLKWNEFVALYHYEPGTVRGIEPPSPTPAVTKQTPKPVKPSEPTELDIPLKIGPAPKTAPGETADDLK
jgi:hypothetical protein